MTRLKRFTAIALFFLGLFEVSVGLITGPIRIYAAEPALAQKLGVDSLPPNQQQTYHDYIVRFQHDWFIVAGFGALTVAASIILGRREKTPQKPTA